ncbi:flavin reductase family protein [Pseudarthrobacter raffinosi]|uniref:flavin reductase family protein n=1 Tax=Pseudarthrobacter raffinosi TaxID=2953651 RepID=UPI00208F0D87|nr:flavin reductase family protein [Pseudarthrobacter sp. MDT3-9]MCO4251229.1 flavin reductase family protein [Pseudarthrobacter sp. MDT3-9]
MIDEMQFKNLMASVPAPVTVLTTVDLDGPAGATVSAFMSLSLEPPMVVASLDNRSSLLARIQSTGFFGVNILANGQADTALTFARRAEDRFSTVSWSVDRGLPRLDGVSGWIVCELAVAVPGGDHSLLLGHVRHAVNTDIAPMVYSHRLFGTNSELVRRNRGSLADQLAAFAR